jgi:hypothetical protein
LSPRTREPPAAGRGARCHGEISGLALALFTFESFAAYEKYREDSFKDVQCQAAFQYAKDTQCILSYERSFFRPVFS